jgi:acylphosphatase
VKRVQVRISGRVQGVGFRVYLRHRARLLGVAGSVRNRGDGTVEATFEGDDDAVDALVRWCEHGPSGARVDKVDVTLEEPSGLKGFSVG